MAEQISPDWVELIANLKKSGWTQSKIAEECSVKQQTISALGSGHTKSPSYEVGMHLLRLAEPGGIDVAPLSVIDVLELCKRELSFVGGCTLTDVPEVPLSPETSWTMDFTNLFAAIDDVIDLLVGADRRTAPECESADMSQPMRPISARSKYVPAHLCTHMADVTNDKVSPQQQERLELAKSLLEASAERIASVWRPAQQ